MTVHPPPPQPGTARAARPLALALCLALAGCRDAARAPAAVPAPDGGGPLVLVVMPELRPYAWLDETSGEVRGMDIDIARDAAARLGRPLEVRPAAFLDLLPMLRRGEADFAGGAITITEGRRLDADFSVPYAVEGSCFLYRAGETPPTMIRAEGMRIGTVESLTPDFYLVRHGIDPIRYTAFQDALDAFRAHRLDAVFYDRALLAATANESGGAFAITPLETRENYAIAVQKGRQDLLAAVNAAIRERNAK